MLRPLSWCRTISTSTPRPRSTRPFLPPKPGGWLDLAESELGVLSSQCLDRRIPDKQTLIDEIAAWEHDRNAHHTKANWHSQPPMRASKSGIYTRQFE